MVEIASFAISLRQDREEAGRRNVQAALDFLAKIMDPPREDLEIHIALALARDWIQASGLRLADEARARAAAKELAQSQGQISTDLSAADFAALCKELKDEDPRVRDDEWISKLRKEYKEMVEVRTANAKVQAEIAKAKAAAKAAAGAAKIKQKPAPKPPRPTILDADLAYLYSAT